MKYFIVAGEASGDLHASNLMRELKKLDSQAEFRFFGGDLMQAQGGQLLKHYRDMAFMGFIAVALNARTIFANINLCKKEIISWKPDILILVDYASFNLRIAEFVKKNVHGLPIHFYISPKIWAWKEYRIKAFRKYIDKMYVILPFETEFFAKHNYPVTYVGNPCLDSVSEFRATGLFDEKAFRLEHGLDERPVLALLPGSRKGEIERNLPLMLEVALKYNKFQVIVSGAPGMDASFYKPYMPQVSKIVFGNTYGLLEIAYAALVTSGTATLETALFSTPQVVCYGISGGYLVYKFLRTLIHIKYFSLVNLISGSAVVPELPGPLLTKVHLTAALEPLLSETTERSAMLQGYKEMQKKMGLPGAAARTAELIYSSML
jgi:lipid-A-disaccharide synthase